MPIRAKKFPDMSSFSTSEWAKETLTSEEVSYRQANRWLRDCSHSATVGRRAGSGVADAPTATPFRPHRSCAGECTEAWQEPRSGADGGADGGGDAIGPAAHVFFAFGFDHNAGERLGARIAQDDAARAIEVTLRLS
jgi:hypothetical protein